MSKSSMRLMNSIKYFLKRALVYLMKGILIIFLAYEILLKSQLSRLALLISNGL